MSQNIGEILQIKSKALEANLEDYRVDVSINPKYILLEEIMSNYSGLKEKLNTFLIELSHPYKNRHLIIHDARGFCLDYFHLLKKHQNGPDAITLFFEIFENTLKNETDTQIKKDAADALLLLLMKVLKEADEEIIRYFPALNEAIGRMS